VRPEQQLAEILGLQIEALHAVAPEMRVRESEEKQRAEDLAWLEAQAAHAEDQAPHWDASAPRPEGERTGAALRARAARYRRILAALTPSPDAETERQMQAAWTRDLEDAVEDALHTLRNEVTAGTVFNEPGPHVGRTRQSASTPQTACVCAPATSSRTSSALRVRAALRVHPPTPRLARSQPQALQFAADGDGRGLPALTLPPSAVELLTRTGGASGVDWRSGVHGRKIQQKERHR
jgi:hypothetical protein